MFIQIIQGRCTRQAELKAQLDTWLTQIGSSADGWLGGTYGFTDEDMFVGVVRFDSRESAMANSARSQQGAWWSDTEKLFDGPVEFHDCDKVVLMLDGGSDDAGFVQVIRGKVDDPSRLETEVEHMTHLLHELRPDIVGATLAIEEDGTFTETVAFTDEAAARAGEAHELPLTAEVREVWQEWDRITHDVSYLDLHQPWFATHR